MTDWTTVFYFSIIGAAFLLAVMGLFFAVIIPGIDRWSRRFFLSYYFVFMLCCVAALVDTVLTFYSVRWSALFYLQSLETLLLALPVPMLTVYLLHCCGEDLRSSRLLRIVTLLWTIFFVVLISARQIGVVTHVEDASQYSRGSIFPILLLPLIAILLLSLAYTIRHRHQLSRKTYISFIIAILPLTVTITLLMFFEIYPLFDISFILSALSMFAIIVSDRIEQDMQHQREIARQQQEIASQRANIMVLQMRPHFIYNTLMSIYSLCNIDPQKARQVTMDFTNYLRKNFNAVSSDSTIPFSAELEHTRAYLGVEQTQYEDMLVVDYDIQITHFRLPPLTLQPIVENAVKHGMDPYSGPLHVSIRTQHTDSGNEIIVEDNGPGFDPTDENKPHPTITNIRQRLEMMCGGKMTITPREGGGTVVKVTIP